jgi:hypothetical protein
MDDAVGSLDVNCHDIRIPIRVVADFNSATVNLTVGKLLEKRVHLQRLRDIA